MLLSLSIPVSAQGFDSEYGKMKKVVLINYIPNNSSPHSTTSEIINSTNGLMGISNCDYCGGELNRITGAKWEINNSCGHWVYWDGNYCTNCDIGYDQTFYMLCNCWD